MVKPICTVMVGLPAMGKSTFIEKIKDSETWIYSTDMYIDSVAEDNGITYDEAFESNIKAALNFNEQKLKSLIQLQKNIIWDQVNGSSKKRHKIVNRMKNEGYTVNCICILHPEAGHLDDLKAWKGRLESRPGKTIPNHVLSNMIETFTEPSLEEGFEKITFYNMHGDVVNYITRDTSIEDGRIEETY